MSSSIWHILVRFINADKLAGWTRALVAVLLGYVAASFGGVLAPYLTPELQTAIGMAAATIVVGIWQQIAKSMSESPPEN